ncbi:MAG: hypothetical protein P8169_06770 [Chloroflexota bacterium]|jgi:hypothetical protein
MLEETVSVDSEEESERKLVHSMALAVVTVIIGGIIVLALRPWIQRFRKRNDGADAPAASVLT